MKSDWIPAPKYEHGAEYIAYRYDRWALRRHCIGMVRDVLVNGEILLISPFQSIPFINKMIEYVEDQQIGFRYIPMISEMFAPVTYDVEASVFRFYTKRQAMLAKLTVQL